MTKKEIQKQENMLVENAWKIAKQVWFSQSIEIDVSNRHRYDRPIKKWVDAR